MNKELNKEKNFISAVVYVHNAGKTVGAYLRGLMGLLNENFEHSEIICVNDHSTDNSADEIRKACEVAGNTAVSIINMGYFHGLEVSMRAGIDLSIGDFVIEIGTTIQDYDLDEIMTVYRKVLAGNDIVNASPQKHQSFSTSLFYWFYQRFADNHMDMRTETFRILSRRAINRVMSMSKTIPYRKGLYVVCGLKMAQHVYPVVKGVQPEKHDRKTRKYRRSLAIDSLLLFTNAGYACAKFMTLVMMFISLFVIVYTILTYASAEPVRGWTTSLLFLSVAFLGLFSILTIVIKYLQILLNLNFRRTEYSFENIEKLTK